MAGKDKITAPFHQPPRHGAILASTGRRIYHHQHMRDPEDRGSCYPSTLKLVPDNPHHSGSVHSLHSGPPCDRQLRRRATATASKHVCHRCGEDFTTITNYNRHKKWSKCCTGLKRPHQYPCNYHGCDKAYSRKDNRDKHERQKHSSGNVAVPIVKGL